MYTGEGKIHKDQQIEPSPFKIHYRAAPMGRLETVGRGPGGCGGGVQRVLMREMPTLRLLQRPTL